MKKAIRILTFAAAVFGAFAAAALTDAGAIAFKRDLPDVPTWTAVTNTATIAYNYGLERVNIASGATLTASTTGWKDGDMCFVVLAPAGTYSVNTNALAFVGYGNWPTNETMCVAWKYGSKVFLNKLKGL